VGSLGNSKGRWHTISNLKYSPPLSKSASLLVILLTSISEAIKSLGGVLAIGSSKYNKTLIDLDSWDDPL
jgi:hypothetical protein